MGQTQQLTADFRSSFWQSPHASNVCLLEDKIKDWGIVFAHIFYGSYRSRRTSCWHSRPKSIAWNDLPQVIFISVTLMLQNLRIGLKEETEWQERCADEAAWRLAKSILKLKEKNKVAFFSPSENRCLPANLKPENENLLSTLERQCTWSAKRDLNSAEIDTLTKSRSPAIVITANGEVQTHEEATVCQRIGYSWLWKSSRIRQQSYRSESFAMKTDILTNGSTVKKHIL